MEFDIEKYFENPLVKVLAVVVVATTLVLLVSPKARMALVWMLYFGHLPTAGEYTTWLAPGKDPISYALQFGKPFAFLNPAPTPAA